MSTTPETPVKSNTITYSKWFVYSVIVLWFLEIIASAARTYDHRTKASACEAYWKETCTFVAVPESIQSNFSQDFYSGHDTTAK